MALTSEQLTEFKELLEQEKVKVGQLLKTVADPDSGDHVPGEYAAKFPNFGNDNPGDAGSDSPDEVQAYEANLALTGDLGQHMKNIEAALQRIEDGSYGKDVNTGAEISIERLKVNPAAETAIDKT